MLLQSCHFVNRLGLLIENIAGRKQELRSGIHFCSLFCTAYAIVDADTSKDDKYEIKITFSDVF
jgi:hypothetical protein